MHIEKHLGGALAPFILAMDVPVVPLLHDVVDGYGLTEVHLLHVETEGHDLAVIETLDLSRLTPVVILVEHKRLSDPNSSRLHQLLRGHGYSVRDCGGDYFALHRKGYADLRGAK